MPYETAALTIAKEALKPTSGVVDALLAPKLQRLRKWAAARDLNGRIDEKRLEDVFAAYMRRLLRRVSGVTTLVFPQQVLALPEIYEPLRLEARPFTADLTLGIDTTSSRAVSSRNPKQVTELSITRPGTRTYIVDSAGMGKSTFARHLIVREMAEHDRIPIFLELRRIADGLSLVEALARDLDELHCSFDRDTFLRLLGVGRFLLVLDGLDEVASAARSTLCQQIEELSIRAEKSAIILTSRPEVPLPTLPGARLLTFVPLDDAQAQSLVRRYDAVGQIDVGERLIARMNSLPQQFLRTPLLVALLYRSFGYNGEVSSKITSFYDELYSALYKGHDLTKAGFARQKESGLDFDAFRRLLRGFAFLMIVQQKVTLPNTTAALQVIEDARLLSGVQPSSISAFLDDLLLSVPVLVKDGPEIRFVHKTIGEFFAAEHIAFAQGGAEIAEEMCRPEHGDRFFETIDFLKEISPLLFKKIVAKPIADAFLAHQPTLQSASIRMLSFIASESRVRLTTADVSKSHAYWHSDNRIIPVQGSFTRNGEEYFVQFALSGPILPLLGTVVSIFVDKPDDPEFPIDEVESPLDFSVYADLPLDEWLPITDHRLLDGDAGKLLELIAVDLIGFYLDRGGNRHHYRAGWPVFSEERVKQVLSELVEEERATSMIRSLLRP